MPLLPTRRGRFSESASARVPADASAPGLGNDIVDSIEPPIPRTGPVSKREHLGGLLSYYYRRSG